MNAETELYQKRIAELEARIADITGNQSGFGGNRLTQLPNGDLWRGHREEPKNDKVMAEEVIEIEKAEKNDELEKAMQNIVTSSRGNLKLLTCSWCGKQTEGVYANQNMRRHLLSNHKSVLSKDKDAEVLMASLAKVQAELAAVTS